MSLSTYLNERKAVTISIGAIMILVAIALLTRLLPGSHSLPQRVYFTVDDGKTWFADSVTNIPPFTKDGKEAVRVHLYRTQGGKQFVAHLERYTAEAKLAAEKAIAAGEPPPAAPLTEVKRPGDSKWIPINGDLEAVQEMTSVRSPDSPYEAVEPVLP